MLILTRTKGQQFFVKVTFGKAHNKIRNAYQDTDPAVAYVGARSDGNSSVNM
jgi:hypothetical protein